MPVLPIVDASTLAHRDPSGLDSAARSYDLQGCLALRGVFAPDRMAAITDRLLTAFGHTARADMPPDMACVGHRRHMVAPAFEGPLHAPEVYANDALMPLLGRLLGEQLILGSVGAVLAWPGAQDQHIHLDHPPLAADGAPWNLPAYAITVMVPLVRVGGTTGRGTTRVWPGSHLLPLAGQLTLRDPALSSDFTADVGDCMLMDYRLVHGGTANTSEAVRPVLYLVYYRQWFRDRVNYVKQPRIAISCEQAKRIPTRHRALFDLAA